MTIVVVVVRASFFSSPAPFKRCHSHETNELLMSLHEVNVAVNEIEIFVSYVFQLIGL